MTKTQEQNLAPCRFPGCGLIGCIYGPHEQWSRENPEVNRPASHGLKRYTIYADVRGLLCEEDGKVIESDGVKVYLASEVDAQRAPVAGLTEQEGFLLSTIESETGVMSLESWRDHARALAGCFRTRIAAPVAGGVTEAERLLVDHIADLRRMNTVLASNFMLKSAAECLKAADEMETVLAALRRLSGSPQGEAGEELTRLRELEKRVNSPKTDEFFEAVRNEAAHQVTRWGEDHDLKKSPPEWIALMVHLLGKAVKAYWEGNAEKYLHHIVTGAAVCLNWHRQAIAALAAQREGKR